MWNLPNRLALRVILVATCAANAVMAQTSEPQKQGRVEKWREYVAQLDEFKKSGRAAYLDEEAHEKAGECPEARTTYDMNVCLGKELAKTETNYKTYIGALRSVEGANSPDEPVATGRTGKPLTTEERVREFDAAESAWRAYYRAQCSAAYDAYRGGTIAPSIEVTCRIRLMRDRMHELEAIYQFMH